MRAIRKNCSQAAFTVIELILVIAIIGLLTAISVPAIKGLTQSHTLNSASRQLMDDLALARQYAINNRSYVYVLFVPPTITTMPPGNVDNELGRRLMMGIYSTYAIFAERTVGDQPGQSRPRYLSKWKRLPDGVFIAAREFNIIDFKDWEAQNEPLNRPFRALSPDPADPVTFPFPAINNPAVELPHIMFSPQGSCVFINSDGVRLTRDEVIELARGSILTSRDDQGTLYFDARESPPNNSINNYNRIRLDGLTGRGSLERPEI